MGEKQKQNKIKEKNTEEFKTWESKNAEGTRK